MYSWQDKLQSFFDSRATAVQSRPNLDDLCYISGRDPRLWGDPELLDDLGSSIVEQLGARKDTVVLEVGCAAGFLAAVVAPRVGRYEGIDLAAAPLEVARRLGLANAHFRQADGAALPFADGTFDAVFCYDVFTNFPRFEDGIPLIETMLRVVKPGGRVLVGSIPDRAVSEGFAARVAEVSRDLDAKYGPSQPRPDVVSPNAEAQVVTAPLGLSERLQRLFGLRKMPVVEAAPAAPPEIICYEFERENFIALGRSLGAVTELRDIHALNPYCGFRFNAIFTRPAS